MKVEGFYRRPLYRQTREGQLIADFTGGTLLNRRGEWGQNLPPKLEIVDNDKVTSSKELKSMPKAPKRPAKQREEDALHRPKKAKNEATENTDLRKVGGG